MATRQKADKTMLELLNAIKAAAKRDAEFFVNELNEALDCDSTDWGAVAWEGTRDALIAADLLTREQTRRNRFAAAYDRLVSRYTREIVGV
jgi:Fe2+ transport system protein B